MNLLNESADHITIVVFVRSYTDIVDVYCSDYILASQFSVLVCKEFVTPSRYDKLIFTWFTTVNFVIAIEKRTVAD